MQIVLGIVLSVLFGVIPMAVYAALLTLFDRYEKEPPLLLIGVFLWGLVVAAGAALVLNTVFDIGLLVVSGSEGLAEMGTAVVSAPLVEETVKGLAVLAVFIYFRNEFDSVLDGVIYGSLVGFGFAAAENINYIYSGFTKEGLAGLAFLVFVRVFVIAFLHATLTACTGIGFAVGRLNRGVLAVAGPILGYVTAIALHAFHNLLASAGNSMVCLLASAIDWLGFLGMFVFILVLVWREGKIMREHLLEEVQLGRLTTDEYQEVTSLTAQMGARWQALVGGRGRSTPRLYDMLGELAFKKYQVARLGPEREREAQTTIEALRQQIDNLGRLS